MDILDVKERERQRLRNKNRIYNHQIGVFEIVREKEFFMIK
jgi:hypothetical protein